MTGLKNLINSKSIFWIIFFICATVRLLKLGEVPAGINQDEAFSAYEALSLLKTGEDSWGYPFPVYFIGWGSGLNALYTYLCLPFFALFGTDVWVLRLPQALFGILSCYIFYRLLKSLYDRPTALIGFFLASVVPWHIMLSRWGLEANLAPFFILTGFYFYIKSFKKPPYLLLSALFYGIGLYAYATAWIYIILSFALGLVWLLYDRFNRQTFCYILASGALFVLLAIPLIAFVLINNNIIAEIRTNYISIPKLVWFRQNEIGFNDLNIKLPRLWRIFITGDDYLTTNNLYPYGIFYPLSLPFILFGLYRLATDSVNAVKQRRFSFSPVILTNLILGLICAIVLYPCINRLNFLWFTLLIILTRGIAQCARKTKPRVLIISLYIGFFAFFTHAYFNRYNKISQSWFTPDLSRSVEIAEESRQKTRLPITVLERSAVFPKILYHTRTPAKDYRHTVVWQNYPAPYLEAASFTHYRFLPEFDYTAIPTDSIYIAPVKQKYFFYQFNVTELGEFIIAVPKPHD